MGLWSGFNISIQGGTVEEKEMAIAEQIAEREQAKAGFVSGAKQVGREAAGVAQSVGGAQARQDVGFQIGRAAFVGMRQPAPFTREQQMLGEMFGQGEKIWGTNQQPVRINNDLNSSRSDPWDETSSMFGWGPHGEKSGMF